MTGAGNYEDKAKLDSGESKIDIERLYTCPQVTGQPRKGIDK
jgi:hypothetical protein